MEVLGWLGGRQPVVRAAMARRVVTGNERGRCSLVMGSGAGLAKGEGRGADRAVAASEKRPSCGTRGLVRRRPAVWHLTLGPGRQLTDGEPMLQVGPGSRCEGRIDLGAQALRRRRLV